jgi:hypothetical protein
MKCGDTQDFRPDHDFARLLRDPLKDKNLGRMILPMPVLAAGRPN